MRKQLTALVDCFSFYCSCERTFRADLKDKPIVVLSNNDGCIISLTPEVKAYDIKIGTPYHKVRRVLEENGVAVFSSNYCLYADMSRRVVNIIKRFSQNVEQYSIDEAFITLDVDDKNDEQNIEAERKKIERIASNIHSEILKGTGIPVRVSVAETKTLAKVGNAYSKFLSKNCSNKNQAPAICFWKHPDQESFMRTMPVSDVWGIGRRWAKKLETLGIKSAHDLLKADTGFIRKNYSIVMERTVEELRGNPCIAFEEIPDQRKSIVRSRMFAKKLNNPVFLHQAICSHLARGAEKLRKEHLLAGQLSVSMWTGKHAVNQRHGYASAILPKRTNDTFVLSKVATQLFEKCFLREDESGREFLYSKAGVTFSDIESDKFECQTLFDIQPTENKQVMETLDAINRKFGKYSLMPASIGTPDKLRNFEAGRKGAMEWGMRREKMSRRFTTKWNELLKVRV